jgi:hypothetical protein
MFTEANKLGLNATEQPQFPQHDARVYRLLVKSWEFTQVVQENENVQEFSTVDLGPSLPVSNLPKY